MYITIDQLKKSLGAKLSVIETVKSDEDLTGLIEADSVLIDNYISQVVTLPLEETPEILKRICLSLSVYDCYKTISFSAVPEVVKDEYNNAIKLLEKIQNRKILLGTQTTEDGQNVNVRFEASNQFFTQSI